MRPEDHFEEPSATSRLVHGPVEAGEVGSSRIQVSRSDQARATPCSARNSGRERHSNPTAQRDLLGLLGRHGRRSEGPPGGWRRPSSVRSTSCRPIHTSLLGEVVGVELAHTKRRVGHDGLDAVRFAVGQPPEGVRVERSRRSFQKVGERPSLSTNRGPSRGVSAPSATNPASEDWAVRSWSCAPRQWSRWRSASQPRPGPRERPTSRGRS